MYSQIIDQIILCIAISTRLIEKITSHENSPCTVTVEIILCRLCARLGSWSSCVTQTW